MKNQWVVNRIVDRIVLDGAGNEFSRPSIGTRKSSTLKTGAEIWLIVKWLLRIDVSFINIQLLAFYLRPLQFHWIIHRQLAARSLFPYFWTWFVFSKLIWFDWNFKILYYYKPERSLYMSKFILQLKGYLPLNFFWGFIHTLVKTQCSKWCILAKVS